MVEMKKLMFCIGTRPEAIKLAPLIWAAKKQNLNFCVVSTGQHKELLTPFLEFFKIEVHHSLSVLKPNQSLSELTANLLSKLQTVMQIEKPSLVLVQGDTTTTFTAALAAFYEKIPVAHIEAGLRTHERYSPFPEEMNRKLVTQITEYFFPPTELAKQNLAREGIVDKVSVTGNTGIDGLRIASEILTKEGKINSKEPSLQKNRKMLLVTCHRRENHGTPLLDICEAILKIVNQHPEVDVVFPVHLNPNVLSTVHEKLGGHSQIQLLKPLDYPEFVTLMNQSDLILTDSGGVQEEAPYFKKPIFVMRESSERPEGITAGVAALVGSNTDTIFGAIHHALTDTHFYESFQKSVSPYGDGFAAEKILAALKEWNAL